MQKEPSQLGQNLVKIEQENKRGRNDAKRERHWQTDRHGADQKIGASKAPPQVYGALEDSKVTGIRSAVIA
jgi:hypothetical protein